MALSHHLRAFNLRQLQPNLDQRLLAHNLFGMSNAYWGQRNLFEALTCAQQALVINESLPSEKNNSSIASILAILANIYHDSGDDFRALELAKRALSLFESSENSSPLGLTSVLNNIGTIQVSVGLFSEALSTFIRVLHICREHFPEHHPRLIVISDNVQRITDMQREDMMYSFTQFWTFLPKIVLV